MQLKSAAVYTVLVTLYLLTALRKKLPPLEEAVAAHLCPPAHPSKPCRMSSALTDRAYSAAGQAASALHTLDARNVTENIARCNETECFLVTNDNLARSGIANENQT